MQQNYMSGDACCFSNRGTAVDPLSVENVVPAGEVCQGCGCNGANGCGCALATVYFPNQVYKAGYCPNEAMKYGTLFPELVSVYKPCGGDAT